MCHERPSNIDYLRYSIKVSVLFVFMSANACQTQMFYSVMLWSKIYTPTLIFGFIIHKFRYFLRIPLLVVTLYHQIVVPLLGILVVIMIVIKYLIYRGFFVNGRNFYDTFIGKQILECRKSDIARPWICFCWPLWRRDWFFKIVHESDNRGTCDSFLSVCFWWLHDWMDIEFVNVPYQFLHLYKNIFWEP